MYSDIPAIRCSCSEITRSRPTKSSKLPGSEASGWRGGSAVWSWRTAPRSVAPRASTSAGPYRRASRIGASPLPRPLGVATSEDKQPQCGEGDDEHGPSLGDVENARSGLGADEVHCE